MKYEAWELPGQQVAFVKALTTDEAAAIIGLSFQKVWECEAATDADGQRQFVAWVQERVPEAKVDGATKDEMMRKLLV